MRKLLVALTLAAAAAAALPAAAKPPAKANAHPPAATKPAAPAPAAPAAPAATTYGGLQAPEIEAKGFILVDADSDIVLAELNADERLEPASLTKLMTGYALFTDLRNNKVKLSDHVRISETAWRTGGSRMFVNVNSDVTLEELIQGMIVQSGNDASVAIAEHLAGAEDAFAAVMNKHAARLGMSGTHFMNATGLPHPEHYTTARDMSKLARAIVHEFPDYYRWYSQREFTYNGITQPNRNRLLYQDASVDGMKTGHTEAAGYCLVSSAKREGMRLISVLMGAKSEPIRIRESKKLLDWGFRFYETHQVYPAHSPLKTVKVWKGEAKEVQLGLAEPVSVTLPRGQFDKLTAAMSAEDPVVAPIEAGKPMGSVRVQLGDKVLAEKPVVALTAVPEGGFFSRMIDSVLMMFQ